MRAQQLQRLSGPSGLELVELAPPTDSGSVMIEVRAAGVTFPELLSTYGRYHERPELPFVPGSEVAGVVRAAPDGHGLRVGDRVVALTRLGGWAGEVAVDPDFVFPLPDRLDFAAGAALVVNYQTAYFSLRDRGRLHAGETVLVHGAAGGLGSAAVQVAHGLGARVIALVSSEEKAEVATAVGADDVIVSDHDWRAPVEELVGARGVDIVFEVIGGHERLLESLRCLRPDGRVIVAGFAGGEIPEVRVNRLLLSNTEVVGAAWGNYLQGDPGAARRVHDALCELVAGGHIRPHIGQRFDLAQAREALELLESRSALGKVVLQL